MKYGLNLRPAAALDFVSLGALVHRLDTGINPFRKATCCEIHVSGGEFNVAANLADCFRLKTGVASAMAVSDWVLRSFASSASMSACVDSTALASENGAATLSSISCNDVLPSKTR